MDPVAGLAPVVAVLVVFEVYCVVDVVRGRPKLLPRWAWIVICMVSIPLGGVLYLVVGKDHGSDALGQLLPVGVPTHVDPGSDAPDARPPRLHPARPATSVTVDRLTKRYGEHAALDGVSLEVPAGSVFGLVGPNGAGKTTMLALLAGLRRPTGGSVSFGDVSARVALLPDTPHFDPWLTAREVVDLSRSLVVSDASTDASADALRRVGLADVADRRVGGFSRGMLQRLGLAATIIGEPDVLLLDEPCSALDPLGRREVLDFVGRLGGDHTVLFCSHILDDVQEVCDRVGVLRDGRLLFQGPLGELLVGDAAPACSVRVRGRAAPLVELLRVEPWVVSVEQLGVEELRLTATSLDEAERHLVPTLARAEVPVISLVPAGADLERVFLELVG